VRAYLRHVEVLFLSHFKFGLRQWWMKNKKIEIAPAPTVISEYQKQSSDSEIQENPMPSGGSALSHFWRSAATLTFRVAVSSLLMNDVDVPFLPHKLHCARLCMA
jgi:hypothetical protein